MRITTAMKLMTTPMANMSDRSCSGEHALGERSCLPAIDAKL